MTFGGVLVGPPAFALMAAATGGYRVGFATFGALSVACGFRLSRAIESKCLHSTLCAQPDRAATPVAFAGRSSRIGIARWRSQWAAVESNARHGPVSRDRHPAQSRRHTIVRLRPTPHRAIDAVEDSRMDNHSRSRSAGNARMARCARRRARRRGPGPRALPDRGADRQGAPLRRVPAVLGQHRVHQHDPGREAGQAPRRLQHRAEDPPLRALERDGDGAPREQGHQRRRPHRELRVGGDALRHRLQPLLARAVEGARRRPRVRAGPLGAGRLRARVHARPLHARADGQLPAGGRRQGHLVVSAPVADAGLLAVPDGVDGPRAADGDLPGAVHEVPAGSRPREHRGPQGLVLLRRRRDGRAGVDGRHRHGGARERSTT